MGRCKYFGCNKSLKWMLTLLASFALLAACSGGGSGSSTDGDGTLPPTTGGDVSALSLPSRIQLSSTGDGGQLSAQNLLGRSAYDDAGTDYATVEQHAWVDDTDALELINTVLGVTKDTGYSHFVNQGPYKALVRNTDSSQAAQSAASTTSTTVESLTEIIVDVTRESNDQPMYITFWLIVNGPEDMPMLVRGHFTVTEGVSDAYPYGALEAHFMGNVIDGEGNIGQEVMQMALSVGSENNQVVIENVDDEGIQGGHERHVKVRVVANADVTEGNAYVSRLETQDDGQGGNIMPDEPTIQQISFNDEYFKATESGSEPVVYAKSPLTRHVHMYKLFDAETGDEVVCDSGFPIEYDTPNGTRNGYVGYYGLWTDSQNILNHGDAVRDMDGNNYTVFASGGKLTKHVSDSMPLSDLTGMELSRWTPDQEDMIVWSGTQFEKVGYRDQNGQIIYYAQGIDAEYHEPVEFEEWEGAWCDALSAYLRLGSLYGGGSTPNNSSTVFFQSEQTVSAADASDLTLYTWTYTLGMPISQTVIDNSAAAEAAYWQHPSEKTFVFDAMDMMLYDSTGTYSAVLSGDVPQGSNLENGYHIGPLTTDHYTVDNWWQANEADEFYTWNTGADQWNHYVTVMDEDGALADFLPPISFMYTHTTANDANGDSTYNGKKFRLQYDGYSLNLPYNYDETTNEWVPLINIADGTPMGPTGSEYVIKAVETSLIMSEVADTSGIAFNNEVEVGAPTLIYDASETAQIGEIPTNVQLKAIKGEVIE